MYRSKRSPASYAAAAARLKALAHPVRLRILARLSESACCVAKATECLGVSQPNASQHLKALREAGLIVGSRQGTRICYRIADERIAAILPILLKGCK
jgi:ArsR family transcriptional regulator, zinc-responsive transcriptional repressor